MWGVVSVLPLVTAIVGSVDIVRWQFSLAGMFLVFFLVTAPISIFGVIYMIMSYLKRSNRFILVVSIGTTSAYICLSYIALITSNALT